jgi:acyl-CoA thioester hydrolase
MPEDVFVLAAAQHAEFRAEIRWEPGAFYRVRAWVGHVGRSSFTVQTEIRTDRDEPDAVLEATMVLMDRSTGRPWPFSEQVREQLRGELGTLLEFRPRSG